MERRKRFVDTSSSMIKELQSMERDSRPKATRLKMDLSKMSDKEMRDKINRELLEQQYNKLFAPEETPAISKGRERVKDTLEVAGGVLGVASSALAIALSIKELT